MTNIIDQRCLLLTTIKCEKEIPEFFRVIMLYNSEDSWFRI